MIESTVSRTPEDVQPRWTVLESLVHPIPWPYPVYRLLHSARNLRARVAEHRLSRVEREILGIALKRHWPPGTGRLIKAALAPHGHDETLVAEVVKIEAKRHWPRGYHALIDKAVRSSAGPGRNGNGRG